MTTTATTKQAIYPPMPVSVTAGLLAANAVSVALSIVMVWAALDFQDAASAMAFYGVYHREPLNQLIHFVGVPCIIWTVLIGQAHLPLTSSIVVRLPLIPPHYLSWATLVITFYIVFYLSIDWVGAVLYAPFMYAMYGSAVRLTVKDQLEAKRLSDKPSWTGTGKLLQWASIVHVAAWYLQIHPGHKIVEGGQPALMQSLGGALTSAPLFAFHEGVWWMGLRQDFQQRVLELVAVYTKQLCESGEAVMRACEHV